MNFYRIENGVLQVGEDNNVPDGFIEYKIGEEPQELLDAFAEKLNFANNISEIEKAKQYLVDTDWVAAKLAEANAGIIADDIKAKYAAVFAERANAREKINQSEANLGEIAT